EDDRVLLQVVSLARDVRRHFHAVREPNTSDLAKRRVRLLRGRGVHAGADPALLRALLQGRRRTLRANLFAASSDELIDRGHLGSWAFESEREILWIRPLLSRAIDSALADVPRQVGRQI